MDSGSTVMLVLLAVAAVAFLGLYAAEAALPLIRRSQVRDALPERGLREAAVRKLRADRSAYHELVRLLSLAAVAIIASLSLALFVRAADLAWPAMALALGGLWVLLLVLMPAVRAVVNGLSVPRLMTAAVVIQFTLWPLVPLRRIARPLFRAPPPAVEPNAGPAIPTGTAELDTEPTVEEQIADEPLEPRERSMILAILSLEETTVREVMVPRVDVDAVEVGASLEAVAQHMLEHAHSRLPVYEEALDNIVGIVYSRDLLALVARNTEGAPTLRELMRPVFFVPESKRADETLTELQERRVQIAVVVDEYGGIAGIVTIEDLLEEIVGEIEDEFDVAEPTIEQLAAGEAVVDARIQIDAFNEAFNTGINPEGFDTLGGFLYSRLGKIPSPGDVVTVSGLSVEVLTTMGRRIKQVRVLQSEHEDDATVESSPASQS